MPLRLTCCVWVALSVACAAQAPSNNACSGAIALTVGVNPTSGSFTNFLASGSSPSLFGNECAVNFYSDVWFTFTPTKTGPVVVTTCGYAGTLAGEVLAVYLAGTCSTGAAALACSNAWVCPGPLPNVGVDVTWNAIDGVPYLLRLGTTLGSGQGTFRLEVTQTSAVAANDGCFGATPLSVGTNSGLSFEGSTADASGFGCVGPVGGYSDVWHTFAVGPDDSEVTVSALGADALSIYSGVCGVLLSPVSCSGSATFAAAAGSVYRIRCGLALAGSPPSYAYSVTIVSTPSPPNDHVGGAVAFPVAATSVSLFGTTVGATDDPTFSVSASCSSLALNSGVFFEYLALSSGKVRFSTDTPLGQQAGSMANTLVAVYGSVFGGVAAACDDNGGAGSLSQLVMDVVQGSTYYVMVCDTGSVANEGTFWITATPLFSLTMSSPSGPGSLLLTDANGAPGSTVLNVLTLTQGAYPYGPIFGLDLSFTELLLQLASNAPPFSATLNGSGSYVFGPLTGLPPLTLFGVALELDLGGNFNGVSAPTSHTIP